MAWEKVSWTNARQILDLIDEDAADAASPDDLKAAPDIYCDKLIKAKNLSEATNFIGHALPRYEAIVWAVQSLLATNAVDRSDPLIVAVLRWIDNPDDSLRRHVHDLAAQERKARANKNLGNAIFFSGGSISQPDLPPVLPPQDATGKLAAAAVICAAYETPDPAVLFNKAIDLGQQIATSGIGG